MRYCYATPFIILLVMLLGGCEWNMFSFQESNQKSFPLTLQGDFLEQKNLIGSSFALQFNPHIILPIETSSHISLKDTQATSVVLQGVFTPHDTKEFASFTLTDIQPLSDRWNATFFPSLFISISIPPFITASENQENKIITLFNNKSEVAKIIESQEAIDTTTATNIQIGKFKAFRYIKNNDIYITLPDIKKTFVIVSNSEDLSLWYGIIESIHITETALPITTENTSNKSSLALNDNSSWNTMYEILSDIIKNCKAYTQDESCQVHSISLSNQWIDLIYSTNKKRNLRSIIERETKNRIAMYENVPYHEHTWQHISGELPNENPLASWQTLSHKNIIPLPKGYIWIFSDLYRFQIAYPENMYYIFSKPEQTIWWQKQKYGPQKENTLSYIELKIQEKKMNGQNKIPNSATLLHESDTFLYILSSSEDISKDTLQEMAQSFQSY